MAGRLPFILTLPEVTALVESKIKTQEVPGQRQVALQLQRSRAYLKEQTEKAKKRVKNELAEQMDSAWPEDRKQEAPSDLTDP